MSYEEGVWTPTELENARSLSISRSRYDNGHASAKHQKDIGFEEAVPCVGMRNRPCRPFDRGYMAGGSFRAVFSLILRTPDAA